MFNTETQAKSKYSCGWLAEHAYSRPAREHASSRTGGAHSCRHTEPSSGIFFRGAQGQGPERARASLEPISPALW